MLIHTPPRCARKTAGSLDAKAGSHRQLEVASVPFICIDFGSILLCGLLTRGLLGLLKRLLDENLRRYRAFREEAKAMGWREGKTTQEAKTSNAEEYQHAFDAIKAPETAALMCGYLHDEHFGRLAALVLAAQWIVANEPSDGKRFWNRVDFSRVEERRAMRASNPAATSAEADCAPYCSSFQGKPW